MKRSSNLMTTMTTIVLAGIVITGCTVYADSGAGDELVDDDVAGAAAEQALVEACPTEWFSVYETDFENGADPAKWSVTTVSPTPGTSAHPSTKFLGQFGNTSVQLSLSDLPKHDVVKVTFDLYIIRSWDGNEGAGDRWKLDAVGPGSLVNTTFSNVSSKNQAHPGSFPGGSYPARTGALESNTLGYTPWGDTVYRITKTFSHSGSTLQAAFSAENLQQLADESWGIDSVSVELGARPVEYCVWSCGCEWAECPAEACHFVCECVSNM